MPRPTTARLTDAVRAVLDSFAAHGDRDSEEMRADPGPLVLATLAARGGSGRDRGARIPEAVLERWLEQLDELLRSGSLEFGPCGPWTALAIAAPLVPKLGRLNRSLWDQVAGGLPRDFWRTRDVRWTDYDLIRGPAGMLLGLVASGRLEARSAATRRRLAVRCARHLLELCADESLAALRLGRDHGDERLRWGQGRVNTGLAHGIAGVALALRSALEHELAPATRVKAALARVGDRLVASSYVDRNGLRAWPLAIPGDLGTKAPATGPQAWCYGTPGIAWSLWECGRVLGRQDLQRFALEAM